MPRLVTRATVATTIDVRYATWSTKLCAWMALITYQGHMGGGKTLHVSAESFSKTKIEHQSHTITNHPFF
jgi:hypothetical protein